MTRLSPCLSCDRHVRAGTTTCPFCASELTEGFEAPIYRPTRRLGRAAMLAFRALVIGTAGATAGCGASTGLEPPGDAGSVMIDSGSPGSEAGVDPGFDAGLDAGFDGGFDAGTIDPLPIPAYGTPAPIDAGPEDADTPTGNLYGAPPVPG